MCDVRAASRINQIFLFGKSFGEKMVQHHNILRFLCALYDLASYELTKIYVMRNYAKIHISLVVCLGNETEGRKALVS